MGCSPFSNGTYFTDPDKLVAFARLAPDHVAEVLSNPNVTGASLRQVLASVTLTADLLLGSASMYVMYGRGEEDQQAIITAAAARSPKVAAGLAKFALPRVLLWLAQAGASGRRAVVFRGARPTYNKVLGEFAAGYLHAQSDQPGYLEALTAYNQPVGLRERAAAAQCPEDFSALTQTVAQAEPDIALAEDLLLATVDFPSAVNEWAVDGGTMGALLATLDPRHSNEADIARLPESIAAVVSDRRTGGSAAVRAEIAKVVADFTAFAHDMVLAEERPPERARLAIVARLNALRAQRVAASAKERLLVADAVTATDAESWAQLPVSAQLTRSLVRRATAGASVALSNLPLAAAMMRLEEEEAPGNTRTNVRVFLSRGYNTNAAAADAARGISQRLTEPHQWAALVSRRSHGELGDLLDEAARIAAATPAAPEAPREQDAEWLTLLGHA